MERPVPGHLKSAATKAESLGWNVSFTWEHGLRFNKQVDNREVRLWQCRDGWQCADVIEGKFQNHRGLKEGTPLAELLENN
jgi:hypothetical protein